MFNPTHAATAPPGSSRLALAGAGSSLVLVGIGLPYLARLPGVYYRGSQWLMLYVGTEPLSYVLIGVSKAINWGSILLITWRFRSVPAIIIAAAIGLAVPAFGHATLDLSADVSRRSPSRCSP